MENQFCQWASANLYVLTRKTDVTPQLLD